MRVDDETKAWLEKKIGMVALETEEGVKSFEICLGRDESNVMIVRQQHHAVDEHMNKKSNNDKIEKNDERPEREISGDELNIIVKKFKIDFKKHIGNQLGIRGEDIDETRELTAYGFDSLSLRRLLRIIETEYGFDLTIAIFFEYPTIWLFAEYLAKEHRDILYRYYADEGSINSKEGKRGGVQTAPSGVKNGVRFMRDGKNDVMIGQKEKSFKEILWARLLDKLEKGEIDPKQAMEIERQMLLIL